MAGAIIKGSDHMFSTIYEGNGGGQKVGKFVPFTDSGTIAKSVIYNRADNPKLSKTPSSTSNRKTFTISVWYKPADLGTRRQLFSAGTDGSNYAIFEVNDNNKLYYTHSGGSDNVVSTRTIEDTSKFYHILFAMDTTQSTAADRLKIYVDGDQITAFDASTYPSQDFTTFINNSSYAHAVGSFAGTFGSSLHVGGNIAEFNFVDGTALTPSTFGLTDTSTGRWIPKALSSITYGTNGFRMEFANSAGQTIGDDTSGNGNDYAVTNLAATDIVTDSPTQNFATGFHEQTDNGTITRSEGNLKAVQGNNTSKFGTMRSTLVLDPNDPNLYYCEYKVDAESGGNGTMVGFSDIRADGKKPDSSDLRMDIGTNYFFASSTYIVNEIDGADAGTGNDGTRNPSYTTNDVMGLAFKAGKIWIAKNNTWSNSGNPGAGTGFLVELPKNTKYRFLAAQYGSSTGHAGTFNFGQKSFTYTPPTGAVNLQQDNLVDEGVKPDFVWIKNRDAADDHQLYDSSRGVQKDLNTVASGGSAEGTTADGLQRFLKGGCQIEDDVSINTSGESYVSWNWVANGGTTSANTSATPTIASNFQVNDTAGFSIVTYTGTGSAGTVQHGLSQAPEWMIIKERGNTNGFIVSHKGLTSQATYSINLSNANAESSSGGTNYWNSTAPTSSVFSIATDTAVNRSSGTYVAWCWYSVPGFSKFGKYTGNANAEGPFVYTGFKPSWVMVKRRNASAQWFMFDNKRNLINPVDKNLRANQTNADSTTTAMDFLSNGFKIRHNASVISINESGAPFIYMAFAEHPFNGNGENAFATAR